MIYLLDVNALIALGHLDHSFHKRVVAWLKVEDSPSLVTCSITELGFIRVLALSPIYDFDVDRAKLQLARLKQNPELPFQFLPDDQDVAGLPVWVKTGKQTTDGHLVQLAGAHGAVLATLDAKIPGAFVIP